jgi:hypothetical protein
MPNCHEMKMGQIYYCEECGLELKVVGQCKECGTDATEFECSEHCTFSCCGAELKLKE